MRPDEDVDPNEFTTTEYHDFLILALAKLGGSARKEPVIEMVGEMLKDQLKPCDKRPMCHYNDARGWQLAAADWTGKTTPVWKLKVSFAHRWLIDKHLAVASGGVQTLNAKGWQYVERLLKEEESIK
jgi:hypothetical protein